MPPQAPGEVQMVATHAQRILLMLAVLQVHDSHRIIARDTPPSPSQRPQRAMARGVVDKKLLLGYSPRMNSARSFTVHSSIVRLQQC